MVELEPFSSEVKCILVPHSWEVYVVQYISIPKKWEFPPDVEISIWKVRGRWVAPSLISNMPAVHV